jgi:hypothetical protein
MKAYEGVGVYIHIFLISALARGEWSASCSCRFTPGEGIPGTHWTGGWVDPRVCLDDLEKRKFLTLPGLELRPISRPARCQSINVSDKVNVLLVEANFFWDTWFQRKPFFVRKI